jgi:hypothetical protein
MVGLRAGEVGRCSAHQLCLLVAKWARLFFLTLGGSLGDLAPPDILHPGSWNHQKAGCLVFAALVRTPPPCLWDQSPELSGLAEELADAPASHRSPQVGSL